MPNQAASQSSTEKQEQVQSIIELTRAGICAGLGEPKPGKMCVEALICYVLGEKHGDSPSCVSATVNALILNLNDCKWSSPRTRGSGLQKLAIAQLGSLGQISEENFLNYVCLHFFQLVLPILVQRSLDDLKDIRSLNRAYTAEMVETSEKAFKLIQKQIESAKDCKELDDLNGSLNAAVAIRQSRLHAIPMAAWHGHQLAADNFILGLFLFCRSQIQYDRDIHINKALACLESVIIIDHNDVILKACAAAILKALVEVNSPGCSYLNLADPDTVSYLSVPSQ